MRQFFLDLIIREDLKQGPLKIPSPDETLLKPVDPNHVADRGRVYCGQ